MIQAFAAAVDLKKRLTADHVQAIANLIKINDYRQGYTPASHDGRIENIIIAIEAPITKNQRREAERFKAFEADDDANLQGIGDRVGEE